MNWKSFLFCKHMHVVFTFAVPSHCSPHTELGLPASSGCSRALLHGGILMPDGGSVL